MNLSQNTLEVLKKRYLLKDDERNVIETPDGLFKRVASSISKAEKNFESKINASQVEEKFYTIMRNQEFMPNSPTLMNAGTILGQLSACFVLPIEDSMQGIFTSLKNMAIIHQTGGGTGFNFSTLRPKGDLVFSTKGEASGPVSFMSIFDQATGVIVQGGRRRGANMGVLHCDHPDIFDFIEAKRKGNRFSNFNLSVGATDKFMEQVIRDGRIKLVNPRTQKAVKEVKARDIFNALTKAAWETGDPGLIFLDEINRRNPTPSLGALLATNPCGELPLLPYESCNLASINLAKVVNNGKIDWQKLKELIRWGIRFLDNVIEVNNFPLPKIKNATLSNRKIGLGVMGFADMLVEMPLTYGSKESIDFAEKIMKFIREESLNASMLLAEERGVFPNYKKSIYAKRNLKLRNATVNTIAPTGTISIIAGCSSGIEPLFALSFTRNILSGTKLFEVNPLFKEACEKKIKKEEIKRIFVTAFDLSWEKHLKIQAAFQKYTDNSVSKTINLAQSTTKEDIKKIYLAAYKLRCKGITIYRYGSKKEQVLSFGAEYSGGCTERICSF